MNIDLVLFNAIRGFSGISPIVDSVGRVMAEHLPYLMLGGAVIALASEKDIKQRLSSMLKTLLVVLVSWGIVAKSIKFFYNRERPFEALSFDPLIHKLSDGSFPSGHAAFFFALGFGIWQVNKKWGGILIGAALVNGIARIFVGVHYPSDIAGGLLIGLLVSVAVSSVFKKQKEKNQSPIPEDEQEIKPNE